MIKQQLRSQNIKVLVKKVITEFDEDFSDCIWLSWSAHGRTSMRGWQYSYLEISGSKVTADIIKDWTLYSRPVVILAACETALDGNINQGWEDYYGIDMAFRIAGAKTVIGTLWAVPDTLAALTTYLLASWFISGQVTPDRGLTSMQGMLRKGRWKQFLLKSEQLSKLPKEVRINIQELQESLWNLPNELFTTPECWAVFRCLGR